MSLCILLSKSVDFLKCILWPGKTAVIFSPGGTKVLNEHGHMVNDAFLKRYLLRLSCSTPVVS